MAWLVVPDSRLITGQVLDAEAGYRRHVEQFPFVGDSAAASC